MNERASGIGLGALTSRKRNTREIIGNICEEEKREYLQGRAKYFIKRAPILQKRAQGRGQRPLTSTERHKSEIKGHTY